MKLNSFKMLGGLILSLVFGMTVLSSCSSDSGGGTSLEDAKYESTAAKYEIQGSNVPYSSIELTASGDYIITKSNYYVSTARPYAFTDKLVSKFIARPEEGTRATSGKIIYGKYTKISDTEYNLEGFGTIVIIGSTDDAASLQITETGKSSYTLTAAVSNQAPESDMTKNLCRTWKIASFRLHIAYRGQVLIDNEYTYNVRGMWNLYNDMKARGLIEKEDEEMPEDMDNVDWDSDDIDMEGAPRQIIFTKSGTYMVLYAKDKLAISTWTWEKEQEGILRYSWNYDSMYQNGSGLVKVFFRGNQLAITETVDGIDKEEMGSLSYTYYLNEVK